jgi:hypothetical protein
VTTPCCRRASAATRLRGSSVPGLLCMPKRSPHARALPRSPPRTG